MGLIHQGQVIQHVEQRQTWRKKMNQGDVVNT